MSDPNLKNSTRNTKNGRYTLGGTTEVSSFAIEWWNMRKMRKDPSDILYIIEKQYEYRMDMLGLLFYGDVGLWWVIAQYNGILDPFTELVEGKLIMVPLKERVESELFKGIKAGGITSNRT